MTQDQFIQLLEGFHHQRLSEEELLSFLKAAEDPRFESLIGEKLHMELVQMKAPSMVDEERADKVWNNIIAARRVPVLRMAWVRYAAAAVIVLFAAGV